MGELTLLLLLLGCGCGCGWVGFVSFGLVLVLVLVSVYDIYVYPAFRNIYLIFSNCRIKIGGQIIIIMME